MNRKLFVWAAALCLAPGGLARAQTEDGVVVNPLSAFDITIDGLFTGGVSAGAVVGEWSDVEPVGFISPPAGTFDDLLRAPPGTPNALTYAAVAPGIQGGEVVDGLYLMYAYGPRTNSTFAPGEFIADVIFPMTVDACGDGCIRETVVRVLFRGAEAAPAATGEAAIITGNIPIDTNGDGTADEFSPSFYDVGVFVDLDGNPNTGDLGFEREIFDAGLEGAVGFGPSPLSGDDNLPLHLLVELEVPLLISANDVTDPESPFFGGVGGPSGYSPDPVFWGASVANDAIDPPASAGIVSIDPNTGATTFDASGVPTIPEPTAAVLALLAAACVARRRR